MTTYKLISNPTDNPKVAKNLKLKVYTAPLHLAPFNLSGYQVCPNASKGCAEACLHTAGNPAFMEAKNKGRIRKTKMFFEQRDVFFELLRKDIEKLKKNTPKGYQTGVRLNATSDIPWESYRVYEGDPPKNIFEVFPDVTFMDYTKRINRKIQGIDNYSLTFSLAEDNMGNAIIAFNQGINVAVVFRKDLPETFSLGDTLVDIPVINGDEHDWRPVDPQGCIVGLKAKGKARGDTSGFVR